MQAVKSHELLCIEKLSNYFIEAQSIAYRKPPTKKFCDSVQLVLDRLRRDR
jgi:hypothetical protein